MANGALYQHSGIEPLRSQPTSVHANIIADPTTGTDKIAATYQESGTANMRAGSQAMHAAIQTMKMMGKNDIPSTVDSFKDNCV